MGAQRATSGQLNADANLRNESKADARQSQRDGWKAEVISNRLGGSVVPVVTKQFRLTTKPLRPERRIAATQEFEAEEVTTKPRARHAPRVSLTRDCVQLCSLRQEQEREIQSQYVDRECQPQPEQSAG